VSGKLVVQYIRTILPIFKKTLDKFLYIGIIVPQYLLRRKCMRQLLRISEAASLALHTTVLMAAKSDELLSTKFISDTLNVSENHLSKVLQRLTRAGIVKPVRGPRGGFQLANSGERISLLEVYEAIEGPLTGEKCLLNYPRCDGTMCILGDLLATVHHQVKDYFENTKLSDLVEIFKRSTECEEVHK
jgi:Rrf2 family protein